MKVHLIRKETIESFVQEHAYGKSSFIFWLLTLKRADWNEPSDILKTFSSADILGNHSNRVVFNIGGNNYRLICHYVFGEKQAHLFVCWIGTHAEYSKLCKDNKQYTISNY